MTDVWLLFSNFDLFSMCRSCLEVLSAPTSHHGKRIGARGLFSGAPGASLKEKLQRGCPPTPFLHLCFSFSKSVDIHTTIHSERQIEGTMALR